MSRRANPAPEAVGTEVGRAGGLAYSRMPVRVSRYPRNRDFWQVTGDGPTVLTMSKREALAIAAARRRVKRKRAARRRSIAWSVHTVT